MDRFVPPDAIDPVYNSGRTYYLMPMSGGQKPYALMRQTMAETGLHAIAKIVFSNREQLVLVGFLREAEAFRSVLNRC